MGRRVRSARGELVDFDVIKIKEQMASSPPPPSVKERRDFVDRRLRRRLINVKPPSPIVEPLFAKIPKTEELSGETKILDEISDHQKETKSYSHTKQKARQKTEESSDILPKVS